jgi:YHS domain-containing protein
MTLSHHKKTSLKKDLVCGMDVAAETAQFTFELDNKTYYFCAAACRDEFKKSPNRYLKQSSFFLKRWWDNYLKRLNKATNGKSQCCH